MAACICCFKIRQLRISSYYLVDKFAAIPAKGQKLQTAESKEQNERYLLNNAVVVNILQNKTITLQEMCKMNIHIYMGRSCLSVGPSAHFSSEFASGDSYGSILNMR